LYKKCVTGSLNWKEKGRGVLLRGRKNGGVCSRDLKPPKLPFVNKKRKKSRKLPSLGGRGEGPEVSHLDKRKRRWGTDGTSPTRGKINACLVVRKGEKVPARKSQSQRWGGGIHRPTDGEKGGDRNVAGREG